MSKTPALQRRWRNVVRTHLGRKARTRQRPRPLGRLALRLWLSRRRLARRPHRLFGPEHVELRLAVKQLDELLALDRLAPHQDVRDVVKLRSPRQQDVARHLVGLLHDAADLVVDLRSEEHTSELQSQSNLVCRLLLEKKK